MRVAHFTSTRGRAVFTAAYRSAIEDVATGYGTVRVHRFGSTPGAPLVLLPGRGGTAAMWRPNVAALAARRSVYALDLLGEPGMSVQAVPLRDTADQVRWLRETLDALDLGAVHLVGASIGGWLALTTARHSPAGIRSVTLLDPAQTLARIPLPTVLRSLGALPVAPAWMRRRFLASLSGAAPAGDTPIERVIAAGMRHHVSALPAPAYPTDDDLRAITVPVLALLGGRSVILDAERARQRATHLLTDVRAEVWPQASHAISGDCADAVNARILEFVSTVEHDGVSARGRT
ncbi:alpha/beta fold hydrolase [Pseudonocardia sp. GCM10023141]|uniref:alpha/beta fold hydrolase n=1 Tax=Pseudonocardia sp. GCM10023141 TaxID=3252653 RepID=UPI003618E671